MSDSTSVLAGTAVSVAEEVASLLPPPAGTVVAYLKLAAQIYSDLAPAVPVVEALLGGADPTEQELADLDTARLALEAQAAALGG